MRSMKRTSLHLVIILVLMSLAGCATTLGLPRVPDESPCTGYIKTGGTSPCASEPINATRIEV